MSGVVIAFAVYRQVTLRTTRALIALFNQIPPGEKLIIDPAWNDAFIERPRGAIATHLLEDPELADFDVLVSLDDDIGFRNEDFWKVVAEARRTGDIVSGAYATRSRTSHLASRLIPGVPLEFTNGGPSKLAEIRYATTGLMAVPRAIFEEMADQTHVFEDANGGHKVLRYTAGSNNDAFWGFYTGFDIIDGTGRFERLSEDYALCERARQLGHKVYCDTSIILEHEGPIEVTVADIPRIGQGFVSTGDALLDTLPYDAATYLGGHPAMIRSAMFGAREAYSDHWLAWRAEHPDAPEKDWYALDEVGQIYILELMRWHLQGGGTPGFLTSYCVGKNVLDYGCGIATFGLRAAAAGAASVLAVDVNEMTTGFANDRAAVHHLDNFIAYRSNIDLPDAGLHARGPFDVIHSWHMLEHVPDPAAVLDELRSLLTPDGLLLFDCDFSGHTQDDPMHHHLNEWGYADVASMMLVHGFVEVSQFVYRRLTVDEVGEIAELAAAAFAE